MGYLLLEGGAEFGGRMAEPDRAAIDLAGGFDAPIAILPTAAAPDHNHRRAGENGRRWFRSLGAKNVSIVPVIDGASADDPALAEEIRRSRLVYLLGGFPGFLAQTLSGSRCWGAALEAYREGAVIAGSSAGAMALCEHYYDPETGQVHSGLELVPKACVLPHHNTFGKSWARPLAARLPGVTLIGIDEGTGMLNNGPHGAWNLYGAGGITVYRDKNVLEHQVGSTLGGALLTP